MTARQIIIKCLDENADITCRKHQCDKPEKEGNTGKCCHKCSLDILKEFENKVYNNAIENVIKLIDDDLTSEIGMDMYVDRDLLCERLEQLKRKERQ